MIADPRFGLDQYAWGLLSVLSTREPDFAKFDDEALGYDIRLQTDVYRSGERNWVMLTMFPTSKGEGPRKVVAFGRDPYVDEIHVEIWSSTHAPQLDDVASAVTRFSPLELMKAAGFIRGELATAYDALR